jgi:phage terminase small subunit
MRRDDNNIMELIQSAPDQIKQAWLSLTERQRALAAALPTSTSKEAAFKAAGYSDSVARKKNQKIPQAVADVAAYLAGAAIKSAVLNVQEILAELAHAVRFDPIDIFDDNDCIKPVTQWPEHARRAIGSIEVIEDFQGHGADREYIGRTKKVKFIGKVEAADKLLRALGAYAPEKVEHTHRIKGLSGLLEEIARTGADVGPGPAASRRC